VRDRTAELEATNAELEAEVPAREVVWSVGELPAVTGDRWLLRVVVNLLSNALKSARSRTPAEIGIEATRQQDHVTLPALTEPA
jgi:signal transduction histidine kinase